MGEQNLAQEAIIRANNRKPRIPCLIKSCMNTVPNTSKTGMCQDHWRRRKTLKSSPYYEGK